MFSFCYKTLFLCKQARKLPNLEITTSSESKFKWVGIQFQHCDSDSQCCFVSEETTDVTVTRGTLWSDKV